MSWRCSQVLGLALLCVALQGHSTECPKKVPAGLQAENLSNHLTSNGLLMDISQVQGKESVADILQRTEKNWRDEGFKVKRNTASGWEILAAIGEKCLVTLQLTARNGSYGYLSYGTPAKAGTPTAVTMGAPFDGSEKITSSVASNDDGREGLVLSATSTENPMRCCLSI